MQPVILDWTSNLFFFKELFKDNIGPIGEYLNMKGMQEEEQSVNVQLPMCDNTPYARYFLSIRIKVMKSIPKFQTIQQRLQLIHKRRMK